MRNRSSTDAQPRLARNCIDDGVLRMSLPSVSVILPVRNEPHTIRSCLDAVLHQDYARSLMEIIVVDGLSEDGTREIVESMAATDSRIRLFSSPLRRTPFSMKIGLAAATGAVAGIAATEKRHARAKPGSFTEAG